MNHEIHIPTDVVHILGYLLFCATIVVVSWLSIKHGTSLISGLKGANNRWDAPEVIILFTIPIYISTLLADVFLGYHASEMAWISIDAALGIGSGARVWMEKKLQSKTKPPKQ